MTKRILASLCLLIVSSLAWADTSTPTEASLVIAKLKALAKGDADELIAAMQTFDDTYTSYRLQKEPGVLDVRYANKKLTSLIGGYLQLAHKNPAEAKLLMEFINDEIKLLKEEFKPNEPFKDVYLNMMPPSRPGSGPLVSGMSPDAIKDPETRREYIEELKQNRLNGIYNERQKELWGLFEFIETCKKGFPEFGSMADAGCDLDEAYKASQKRLEQKHQGVSQPTAQ